MQNNLALSTIVSKHFSTVISQIIVNFMYEFSQKFAYNIEI